jgi:hypothetical protein
MDMTSSLVSAATQMSAAKTAYQASIMVAKKALDVQETVGQSLMKLIDSGSVNNAQSGAATGSNVDFRA